MSLVQQYQFNIPFQLESSGNDPHSFVEVPLFNYSFIDNSLCLRSMWVNKYEQSAFCYSNYTKIDLISSKSDQSVTINYVGNSFEATFKI